MEHSVVCKETHTLRNVIKFVVTLGKDLTKVFPTCKKELKYNLEPYMVVNAFNPRTATKGNRSLCSSPAWSTD